MKKTDLILFAVQVVIGIVALVDNWTPWLTMADANKAGYAFGLFVGIVFYRLLIDVADVIDRRMNKTAAVK